MEAETAADALNTIICAEAQASGYGVRSRISPGYGSWDVSGQQALFGLLPGEEVGVNLTAGMMMVPRKSVSFAVRLGAEAPRRPQRRCERCGMKSCSYRKLDD